MPFSEAQQPLNSQASQANEVWSLPQERLELKPYSPLRELDLQEQETLMDFVTGPQVEYYCELNDETDLAVRYQQNGSDKVVRVSQAVTINGVQWNLQPGKNIIPRPVYEFLMQAQNARDSLYCPKPGQELNLGLVTRF